jgi:uncharacterized protein
MLNPARRPNPAQPRGAKQNEEYGYDALQRNKYFIKMRRRAHFLFGGLVDEQLVILIQLQELDGNIRALTAKKNRLPELLAELQRRRMAGKEMFDAAGAALQKAQKAKRERDQELEAGLQKVQKLKARTSEIKTNKEYQALLREIETAELENKNIEDGILTLMETIDAAAAEITKEEARSSSDETALKAEQQQLESDFTKLESDLRKVLRERVKTAALIEPITLCEYERLLAARGGVALAEVRLESCSGCCMSIPPQVFVNVRKNEAVIPCPHCGRILYYKEAVEQK